MYLCALCGGYQEFCGTGVVMWRVETPHRGVCTGRSHHPLRCRPAGHAADVLRGAEAKRRGTPVGASPKKIKAGFLRPLRVAAMDIAVAVPLSIAQL